MEQDKIISSSSSPPIEDTLPSTSSESSGFLTLLYDELISSPLNLFLTIICCYLLYKLLRKTKNDDDNEEVFVLPPPLPKHDMTLEELRKYDGTGEDKRVCIGVNGSVYDCTKGRQFYGPGGPYAAFAGHDATRALANFDVAVKETWDDTSDLNASQLSSLQEWEAQFAERYDLVGKLLKELPIKEEDQETEDNKDHESGDHVKSD